MDDYRTGYRMSYPFWIATHLFLKEEDRSELYTCGLLYKIGELNTPKYLSKMAMLFWPWMKRQTNKS